MYLAPTSGPHFRNPQRQSSFPLSRRMSQPIQYQDEHEQRDAELQLQWTSSMAACGGQNSSHYQQVKALVISWDEDSDDLNSKPEVDKFAQVLTEQFNYKVVPALLKQKSKHLPQVQITHHISEFVWGEDGPNTLLIVYYAGHGTPETSTGRLKLAGKRGFNETLEESNEVIWDLVETNLQKTRADVLEIFDCCYAGDLGQSQTHENRSMGFSPRSFEFLGATSSNSLTRCPGEKSFTSALIWALKKLATEKVRGRFTVSELSRRIKSAPNFPRDQVPVLLERSESSLERIILAPLEKAPNSNAVPAMDTAQQYLLRLNYVFTRPPTEAEVTRFAEASRKIWTNNNMPLDRIVWSGLSPWGGTNPSAGPFVAYVKAANAFNQLRKRKSLAEEEESGNETSPHPTSISPVGATRPRRSPRTSRAGQTGESTQLPTPQSQTPRSASEANETSFLSEPPRSSRKKRRS